MAFNPNQPRDYRGRWTSGGISGGTLDTPSSRYFYSGEPARGWGFTAASWKRINSKPKAGGVPKTIPKPIRHKGRRLKGTGPA